MAPSTFGFERALAYLKVGTAVSRFQFGNTCIVKAQRPDENSKMTQPYLYMEKVIKHEDADNTLIRFPFDPSCESLFAEDWYVVED